MMELNEAGIVASGGEPAAMARPVFVEDSVLFFAVEDFSSKTADADNNRSRRAIRACVGALPAAS